LTFREWGELLLVAICVVWYNPEFFPPAQTAREFRALTLALPTDGSEDTQAKVLLLSQEIDSRLLQPMTLHRLAELRKEIKAQPIEAADQQELQEAIMWSKQMAMSQTGWKLRRQLCFGTM